MFYRQMREFADRREIDARRAAFSAQFPTYEIMSDAQLKWYFCWRDAFRRGTITQTDASYVLVHAFEILAGVGWSEPKQGLESLMRLWLCYRAQHPELDERFADWTVEFAMLYNLPRTFDLPAAPRSQALRDCVIDAHVKENPLTLPICIVKTLCDWPADADAGLEDRLLASVRIADGVLRAKSGSGILQTYGPSRKTKQKMVRFAGAMCPGARNAVEINMRAYSQSGELRAFFGKLARLAQGENADLDAEIADAVRRELKMSRGDVLRLDLENIKQLRAESDAVRRALEVEEEKQPEVQTVAIEYKKTLWRTAACLIQESCLKTCAKRWRRLRLCSRRWSGSCARRRIPSAKSTASRRMKCCFRTCFWTASTISRPWLWAIS